MTLCAARPHCLQPRAANLVNRHGRDAHVKPADQACLSRRILTEPCLDNMPMMTSSTDFGSNARAAHRFGDDFRAQLRRGKRSQPALKFSYGRAGQRSKSRPDP